MNNKITKLMHMPVISANNYNKYRNNFFFEKIKKIMRCCSIAYTCLEYYRNYIFSKKSRYFYYKNFIYHEPCYILRPYSGIKICNVHDLSHIYYIECHPRERVKFLFKYLPKSIKEADHLITGSHFMRNEIINYFRISPEKITTIYHGVSKIFRPRQFVEIAHILARYGLLEKSYLLSVGTLEPRKNLERLIQAFNLLPERQRKKFPLVLVGMKGWGTHRLMKLINQLIRKEELYCLGYVSSDDLPYLYSGAYGFVYVSLYEGFGLPLLEATVAS
ncbi:MAG: glycosyltransferase family 1 protein [Rickettsia endosymbiont of Ixodes persulcatus]|nr:glycosyltransferase family 1 protein [Rickettsia endosymbiont of Ixodes persulcatus]